MANIIKMTYQLRRSPAAEWSQYNPILKAGEPGFEIDTFKIKIGNGVSPWNDLPYLNEDHFSVSVDGSSLIVNQDEAIQIYGFKEALPNQIPYKDNTGKIKWTNLALRRDNDFNYEKIKNTFIPVHGEICLVDTISDGLRVKCGDGVSTYAQLSYIDGTLIKGYLFENKFYSDKEHLHLIKPSSFKLYLDYHNYSLYSYDKPNYVAIYNIPTASDTQYGVIKLYSTTGQNIDGSMTQKAITDELDDKIEMKVHEGEETLFLDYNIQ